MKTRHIFILAIVLVLLIAGVVFQQLQKPAELTTEEYAPLDLSFDSAQVAKLQIGKGSGDTDNPFFLFAVIKSDPGPAWSIPDFSGARADQNKIDQFLKEIREAKGELRANDPSLFSDFAVDKDQAFQVILSDKDWKSLLTFYIGAKRAGASGLFVRQEGSNTVYMTHANLLGLMGFYGDTETEKPAMDYWAALDLVKPEDAGKVERLEITRMNGREIAAASVAREADPADSTKKRWKYLRADLPFALDAEKVRQFLSSIPNWKASKALDPKAKDYGFAKPHWQMKLGLEGGEEIVLTAGAEDEESNAVYMQVSREPVVFQLPRYYFQNFDIDDSKFFVDNPLSIEPEKTVKLIVHADANEFSLTPKEKKWDSLVGYLNDLKTLTVTKLLFSSEDQKKVKAQGRHWLEIQMEGASPVLLDIGNMISEQTKEYAARKRDGTEPFAIPEFVFKRFFENLDRLAEPKSNTS